MVKMKKVLRNEGRKPVLVVCSSMVLVLRSLLPDSRFQIETLAPRQTNLPLEPVNPHHWVVVDLDIWHFLSSPPCVNYFLVLNCVAKAAWDAKEKNTVTPMHPNDPPPLTCCT